MPSPLVKQTSEGQLGLFDAPLTTEQPALAEPMVWRHPRANRECRLGEAVVAYEFKRGQRRTIGLNVGSLGLSVRAPRWTPVGEVEAFVQAKAAWVLEKLRLVQQRQRSTNPPQTWHEGSAISYLGQTITIALDSSQAFQRAGAVLQGERLLIGLARDASPERLRETVHAWLMREAQRIFLERLEHFAPRLGVRYSRLRLSSAGTRWGSASADGSIRLNWRLVHLSLEMIDYVVAHELSHLREMNHSPDFWGVVQSVMPDYDQRRRALRQVRLRAD